MKKLVKKLKKPIVFIPALFVILAAIPVLAYFAVAQKNGYETHVVKRGNIVQEIGITGKVKPAESVDLAFEKSGRVAEVAVKVGDKVSAGQALLSLENSEFSAQLAQALAEVQIEEAGFDEMRRGTRTEEIQVQETKIANLKVSLETAKKNLKDKLQDTYTKSDDAVRSKVDQFFDNPASVSPQLTFLVVSPQLENDIEGQRLIVENILVKWQNDSEKLGPTSDFDFYLSEFFQNLDQIRSFLEKTSLAVNSAELTKSGASIAQTTLDGWKADVATGRTNVNTAIANLTAADEKMKQTEADLRLAESELALKKAGSTPEQIAAQQARVEKAKANAAYYRAQVGKTIIRTPIDGIVTKQDSEIGELIVANTPVVSVISQNKFEVEANIPEADVAKIQANNPARITLDAYGEESVFEARVISVEPAETVTGGVATYKTDFQFLKEDNRIKSGMTANIRILTVNLQNVIVVPQRAVVAKNGERFVQVFKEKKIQSVSVKIGLRGTDGNVEVLEGLQIGDAVVMKTSKQK